LHGFQALSLTEYSTSAAASIAAGSVVEIAGAFFTFAGDEAINASSWTSIVTGTTAYITLTASGTAGSQIVDAAYTSTAPTWRDDFQGWYASAASNVRVIGTVYKAEATSYYPKFIYGPMQDGKLKAILGINTDGPATCLSTLSVSGNIDCSGNTNISGTISSSSIISGSGIAVKNYFHSDTPTQNAIFDALSPSITTTGQSIIVSGALVNSGLSYIVTRATRASSTTIDLYTLDIESTAGIYTFTCTDGGGAGGFAVASLAW